MKHLNKLFFALVVLIISTSLFSCSKKSIGYFNNSYQKFEAKNMEPANVIEKSGQPAAGVPMAESVAKKEISTDLKSGIASPKASPLKSISEKPVFEDALKTNGTKAEKKAIKKEIKEIIKNNKVTERDDINTVLLVIVAILLPPLAVFLVDGFGGPFLLSILLWLLFYFPGLIYALYRIFKED